MFKLKEDPTYLDFEYNCKIFKIEITESKITVEDIGEGSLNGGSKIMYRFLADHLCGANGYGYSLDDVCDGCQEARLRSDILDAAFKYVHEVFVSEISEVKIQNSIRKAKYDKEKQEKLEKEELERKLKIEATKALPGFLENQCLLQITSQMKSKTKEAFITIGFDTGGFENFLAKAAAHALRNEGLKVEIEPPTVYNVDSLVYLHVTW